MPLRRPETVHLEAEYADGCKLHLFQDSEVAEELEEWKEGEVDMLE